MELVVTIQVQPEWLHSIIIPFIFFINGGNGFVGILARRMQFTVVWTCMQGSSMEVGGTGGLTLGLPQQHPVVANELRGASASFGELGLGRVSYEAPVHNIIGGDDGVLKLGANFSTWEGLSGSRLEERDVYDLDERLRHQDAYVCSKKPARECGLDDVKVGLGNGSAPLNNKLYDDCGEAWQDGVHGGPSVIAVKTGGSGEGFG
ncbi:hypothetical protein P691DRAFT_791498 [Macrolepiota fuliginosa MF-IS2]|uniref:Uncharacterized protein n=1 Tax=Macrolepiota fuliginosa MF-IS2 TaxID=1400762 RepID=A0A9P5X0S4_9AGAR|nr:hypothetical protein P691DRAFT_791498 [Macrolepiota fuliginosa MF-IS2]